LSAANFAASPAPNLPLPALVPCLTCAEGDLRRGGAISLLQFAAGGEAFLFDLVAMQPAVAADVLGVLRGLLESRATVKVRGSRGLAARRA